MLRKIFGGVLTLWGLLIIGKDLFITPTIFDLIKFYGYSAYVLGSLFALVLAVGLIWFGIRLLRYSPKALEEK